MKSDSYVGFSRDGLNSSKQAVTHTRLTTWLDQCVMVLFYFVITDSLSVAKRLQELNSDCTPVLCKQEASELTWSFHQRFFMNVLKYHIGKHG